MIPLARGGVVMDSIRARKENGLLTFDFRYQGTRCREQTTLPDTAENRRRMETVLKKIEAETTLGTFDYGTYLPNSPTATKSHKKVASWSQDGSPATDSSGTYSIRSPTWQSKCLHSLSMLSVVVL
uniref:Arm DNA-binding domain-containing protein n=1 Tax=Citrifermentans bremense TaxID=60035 RepID=UPI00384D666F